MMKGALLFPIAATLCNGIAIAASIPWQAGGPVTTTSGIVSGTTGRFAQNVSAYLGVPYALPPVGERRWLAPQKLTSTKSLQAKDTSADCPGTLPFGKNGIDPSAPLNEDCLYLNVWAPPIKTGDAPKAVLVWIYGGAFIGGSAGMAVTDGSHLAAKHDVLVVAMNYRLSALGFPGAPGLPDENLGILDQRLAIEWVRDNIKGFGGDPNRIVIFGESAGADSVDIYSYAWTKDPIVKGFIGESGGATMCGLVTNASRQNWPRLVSSLECSSAPNQLACMRGKNVTEIIKAAGRIGTIFPPAFVPMPDGKIVFGDYPARAAKGQFIKAPYIIGNNDKELGTLGSFADKEFTCPSAQISGARKAAGVNTWRYRFYAGGGNPQAKAVGIIAGLPNPAMHATDLFYVFGTFGTMGVLGAALSNNATPQKVATSNEIQQVWAAFAKDPQDGPTKLGWPVYDPKGKTLVRLMYQNETVHSLGRGDEYDGNCPTTDCKNLFGFGSAGKGSGTPQGGSVGKGNAGKGNTGKGNSGKGSPKGGKSFAEMTL